MLIADLKGKLSLSELISEDFLTSSVFSVLRYLDEDWLEKFINKAVNIKDKSLNVKLQNPRYEFWPWYLSESKYVGGAEPDVVIYSKEIALIIEAKNYSGKSGQGIIEIEAEGLKEEENNSVVKVIIDQLAREYFIGLNRILNVNSIKSFYLIFLTRHSIFPRYEIEETLESIKAQSESEYQVALDRIYWLNWQKVVPVLEEIVSIKEEGSCAHMISRDLIEFLERRDLGVFSGFKVLDYYTKFSTMFEFEMNIDFLFYRKIFYNYWEYLDNLKLLGQDHLDNVFYRR